MPPTKKILAIDVNDESSVTEYPSLCAAAKAYGFKYHSNIMTIIKNGTIVENKRFVVVDETPYTENACTFFDEVDGIFRGKKIRYTTSVPGLASVYDVIRAVTDMSNPITAFSRIVKQYGDRIAKTMYQFAGEAKPTPAMSLQELLVLVNYLPGEKARRFCESGASVLTRYLCADPKLIDEIHENAEKLEQISATNSECFLGQVAVPVYQATRNVVCSTLHSPSMNGRSVGDIRGACVYMLVFDHKDSTAVKFGSTKRLRERVSDHFRTYKNMRVWLAIECDNIEVAEKTEQLFKEKIQGNLIEIDSETDKGKKHIEIVANKPVDEVEACMRDAYDIVMNDVSAVNEATRLKLEREHTLKCMEMYLKILDKGGDSNIVLKLLGSQPTPTQPIQIPTAHHDSACSKL